MRRDEDVTSQACGYAIRKENLRLGDVINLMMDREKFMCIPGMGPTKYQRLKEGLMEHGWPMDKILPETKKKRRKK